MEKNKFPVHFGLASFFIFILTGCNQQKNNDLWPIIDPLPLSIDIESQIDEMLPKLKDIANIVTGTSNSGSGTT